jgi:predicted glycosyltransferase involved in capsule biosynthesis
MDAAAFILLLCFILCGALLGALLLGGVAAKIRGAKVYMGGKRNTIAIIVPFGDLNTDEHRSDQLATFVKHMAKNLPKNPNFVIFVGEQIAPKKYFNKGQLYNIVANYAIKECNPNMLIFHDVDLLPDKALIAEYSNADDFTCLLPKKAIDDKYSMEYTSICGGAITSIKPGVFAKINGFPNNFWGWGAEDVAITNRATKHNKYWYTLNSKGNAVNIDVHRQRGKEAEKDEYLKKNNLINEARFDLLKDEQRTWRTNGYNQLDELNYEIASVDSKKMNKIQITHIKVKLDELK